MFIWSLEVIGSHKNMFFFHFYFSVIIGFLIPFEINHSFHLSSESSIFVLRLPTRILADTAMGFARIKNLEIKNHLPLSTDLFLTN